MQGRDSAGRLIVVANRLPYTLESTGGDKPTVRKSSGGLVSAMEPVLRESGGVWIGWSGLNDVSRQELHGALHAQASGLRYALRPVEMTQRECDAFYQGFSNEILWPLLHDLQTRCRFVPRYWEAYRAVNEKYAEAVAETATRKDLVWIHDYHLMSVASQLRERKADLRLGFFLHTPFPPLDVYRKLPWWEPILQGLLACDFVGLQTRRDLHNFTECVSGLPLEHRISDTELNAKVGVLPIGIDYRQWEDLGRRTEVREQADALRRDVQGERVVLGVDRLDYTKGLIERLQGFGRALERFPELCGQLTLVQHVVPSREQVQGYRELRWRFERLVGEINGYFGTPGWVPVRYSFHRLSPEQLAAYYMAADVALITPLKDGMNLVAKEFCATRSDLGGILVLSEFAGCAEALSEHAVMVNPYDIEGVAAAIRRAVRMEGLERRRRMTALRAVVRRMDVHDWARAFLRRLAQTAPGVPR